MLYLKPIADEKAWESFLKTREDQNFLQSWYWGETQEKLDKKIFRLGVFSSQACRSFKPDLSLLQGIVLLIKEEARRGSYLACPAGPLLNWENKDLFPFFVAEIKKIAKKERVCFIRIRPQLLDAPENQKLFKNQGFIPAPMHMHAETTWQLSLQKAKPKKHPVLKKETPGVKGIGKDLLRNMDKGHRYEIRKAKKKGVKVVASRDLKDVNILYQMQLETAKRHHFVPFSKKRLRAEFEAFLKNDNALLFKAIVKKHPVAIAMFIYYGKEIVYHYSASTQEARKTSASYLVLWEAIKEAQKRNIKRFNFWGIAPEGQKHHRFAGLNHFKKGFGGFQVDYLPAHDLPLKPTYWLTFLFETLRKKVRRL